MSVESEIFALKRGDPLIEYRYAEAAKFNSFLESRGRGPETWDEQPLIDSIEAYLAVSIEPHNHDFFRELLRKHFRIGGY